MFRNPTVDVIVVLVIALLILGPKRLPGLGKGLGQGMREFKEGITGSSKDDEEKPGLSQSSAAPETQSTHGTEHAASGSGAAGSDRS